MNKQILMMPSILYGVVQISKWKNAFYVLIIFCLFFIFEGTVHGEEKQVILLVTKDDSWEQWIQREDIKSLLSSSSIGYMNIRANHKENILEYYNSINAGRKWSYTENNTGAVENGLGDIVNRHNLSAAFFGSNPLIAKLVESSEASYVKTIHSNVAIDQAIDILTRTDLIVIEQDIWMNNTSFKRAVWEQIKRPEVVLIVLCPYSETTTLTPILFHSSFSTQGGLLTSNSTKRMGIITNNDIGPMIVQKLGISSQSYSSQGIIEEIKTADPYKRLQEINTKIQFVSKYRSKVIEVYITVMVLALMVSIILQWINTSKLARMLNTVLFTILGIPLLLLIHSRFLTDPLIYSVVGIIALGIAGWLLPSTRLKLVSISSVTVLLLAFDMVFHLSLQQQSFLGYDPIIGARFYGIGNEYAGVFIGCFFLFLSNYQINTKNILLHYGALIGFISVLGFPFWGANFGGTIAGIFGCIAYFLITIIQRKNKLFIKVCIGGTLLFSALWIYVNTNQSFSQSHIGLFFHQVIDGNKEIFLDVLKRKLLMNLQLIRYTLWTKFLLVALISMIWFRRQENEIPDRLIIPLVSSMIGAILFNDSGIIMASTIMIFLAFPTILLYNGKRKGNLKIYKG